MTRYVLRAGQLVEKRLAPRRGAAVISDAMDPIRSMVTGKMHTSKSALRAEYREKGVYEVGNDLNDAAVYPVDTHDPRTGRPHEPWPTDSRQMVRREDGGCAWSEPPERLRR